MDAVEETSREIRMPNDATCLGCGYALVHLQHPRCPECGRAFNPRYPSTFNAPSLADRLRQEREQRRLLATARKPTRGWRVFIAASLLIAVISGLSLPPLVYLLFMLNWIVLAGLGLRELSRRNARAELGMPPLKRPPFGRRGWKFFGVVCFTLLLPIPTAGLLLAHLPLLAREARTIEADSFHYNPPPQWIGMLYIQTDRCPHATYFIAPIRSSVGQVTLLHRTSDHTCDDMRGIPIGSDWVLHFRQGRGRDPQNR